MQQVVSEAEESLTWPPVTARRSDYASGIVAPLPLAGYHDDAAVAAVSKLATTPRSRRSRRSLEDEARQVAAQAARAEAVARERRARDMQEWQALQRAQATAAAGSRDMQSTTRPSTAPLAPVEYTNTDFADHSPGYERGVAAVQCQDVEIWVQT